MDSWRHAGYVSAQPAPSACTLTTNTCHAIAPTHPPCLPSHDNPQCTPARSPSPPPSPRDVHMLANAQTSNRCQRGHQMESPCKGHAWPWLVVHANAAGMRHPSTPEPLTWSPPAKALQRPPPPAWPNGSTWQAQGTRPGPLTQFRMGAPPHSIMVIITRICWEPLWRPAFYKCPQHTQSCREAPNPPCTQCSSISTLKARTELGPPSAASAALTSTSKMDGRPSLPLLPPPAAAAVAAAAAAAAGATMPSDVADAIWAAMCMLGCRSAPKTGRRPLLPLLPPMPSPEDVPKAPPKPPSTPRPGPGLLLWLAAVAAMEAASSLGTLSRVEQAACGGSSGGGGCGRGRMSSSSSRSSMCQLVLVQGWQLAQRQNVT